mmetsp:Transcript_17200/g.41404  ORF Transcript_17200/g.41404 Transcript_17200/m.41404 type:complete len:186 (-) Transcript_17200:539-1096(-)
MPPPSTSLGSAGAITRESLSRVCQQILDASLSPTSNKHILLIGEIQSLRLAPRLLKEAAHKEVLFSEYTRRLRQRMDPCSRNYADQHMQAFLSLPEHERLPTTAPKAPTAPALNAPDDVKAHHQVLLHLHDHRLNLQALLECEGLQALREVLPESTHHYFTKSETVKDALTMLLAITAPQPSRSR